MPTGYTAGFQDRDVSFNEFVWTAARGFGAFIHLRDEGLDAKLEATPYDDYYEKSLERSKRELEDLKKMSLQIAGNKKNKDHARQVADAKDGLIKHKALRERYTKVLNQTKAWNPPTKDHQGLKDFMIQQLTQSIEFDCDDKYYQEVLERPRGTAAEWLKDQIKSAEWNVNYHTEQVAKMKESFINRTKWIKELQAAVPMETK